MQKNSQLFVEVHNQKYHRNNRLRSFFNLAAIRLKPYGIFYSPSEFPDYFKEPVNPNAERGVILYALGMSEEKAASIESVGVKVFRNIYDLLNYIKE